jgi:hypothetical protein
MGTYDLATLTPIERPAGQRQALSAEDAARLEKAAAAAMEQGDQAIKGDRAAPPKGGDGSTGAAGNVGGYNTFWLDPGSSYTVINGEKRSSLIVDPPDGKVPPYTETARQRMAAQRARPTSDAQESKDPGLEPSAARSANDVFSGSRPRRARPRCRITSTTTCIRSCRRKTTS